MPRRKAIIYLIFAGLLFLLYLALGRLYSYLTANLDDRLAVAVSAGIVILVLTLFFSGVVFSWGLILIARRNGRLFARLSRACPWLFSLVCVERRKKLEDAVITNAKERCEPVDEEVLAAIRMPKRQGRRRRYPDKVIRGAVLAWEGRGPNFPLTLPEFLEERFGSTSTGMPNVPPATFYDWRKDILAEAGVKSQKNQKKP